MAAIAPLPGVMVLVVDDEPDAREYTATVLRQAGAVVEAAGSAPEALEILERFLPQIVLCDIAMPDRDGFDLIADLRKLPPPRCDIPVAALTAYAKSEDQRRVLEAGFRAYLAKPLEPGDIAAVVAAVTNVT